MEDLVVSNRYLASKDSGVFDPYGHVSVRSKVNPNHYYVSRWVEPALVTLPVAGVFGVTALVGFFRARARAPRSGVAAMAGGGIGAVGAVETVESIGAVVSGEPAADVGDAADELAVAGSEQAAP